MSAERNGIALTAATHPGGDRRSPRDAPAQRPFAPLRTRRDRSSSSGSDGPGGDHASRAAWSARSFSAALLELARQALERSSTPVDVARLERVARERQRAVDRAEMGGELQPALAAAATRRRPRPGRPLRGSPRRRRRRAAHAEDVGIDRVARGRCDEPRRDRVPDGDVLGRQAWSGSRRRARSRGSRRPTRRASALAPSPAGARSGPSVCSRRGARAPSRGCTLP